MARLKTMNFLTAVFLACLAAVLIGPPASGNASKAAQTSSDFDPSGSWKGKDGDLALIVAGDELAFSYLSVFGPSAHICEGGGMARRVTASRFEYRDDQGAVAFLVTEGGLRMETVEGVPSFCGANWPGESFPRDGYRPPRKCQVAAARAIFHAPGPLPPSTGRSYVVEGDVVDVVPLPQGEGGSWLLSRFKGPKKATAGLLRRSDLRCGP